MKYLFIILLPILYSCNKLDGKIETRNKGKVYLVNASTTQTFKFTVKTTSITNDSIYNYQTKIIELAPGDEVFLGNKYEVSQIEYPDKNITIFQTYPVDISLPKGATLLNGDVLLPPPPKKKYDFSSFDKAIKKNKSREDIAFKNAFEKSLEDNDTIINGEHLKYTYSTIIIKDTLHPYPINRYKYNYEVTGQVEIKLKADTKK